MHSTTDLSPLVLPPEARDPFTLSLPIDAARRSLNVCSVFVDEVTRIYLVVSQGPSQRLSNQYRDPLRSI